MRPKCRWFLSIASEGAMITIVQLLENMDEKFDLPFVAGLHPSFWGGKSPHGRRLPGPGPGSRHQLPECISGFKRQIGVVYPMLWWVTRLHLKGHVTVPRRPGRWTRPGPGQLLHLSRFWKLLLFRCVSDDAVEDRFWGKKSGLSTLCWYFVASTSLLSCNRVFLGGGFEPFLAFWRSVGAEECREMWRWLVFHCGGYWLCEAGLDFCKFWFGAHKQESKLPFHSSSRFLFDACLVKLLGFEVRLEVWELPSWVYLLRAFVLVSEMVSGVLQGLRVWYFLLIWPNWASVTYFDPPCLCLAHIL